MRNRKFLVVVDESRAAQRALRYVARLVGARRDFRVCLAHNLPAPPPELAELRGGERARIRAYRRQWITAVKMTEQGILERANAILRREGLARGACEAHYCYLADAARATRKIIDLARTTGCGTVVIGRGSLSWVQELIRGDPAEELVRLGKGLAVWVIE